jgi:hypothetical protein
MRVSYFAELSQVHSMVYHGHVQNGVVIFDDQARLPDGTPVVVSVNGDRENGQSRLPSLTSLIGTCGSEFATAQEVDTSLRALRDEWDRPWHPRA